MSFEQKLSLKKQIKANLERLKKELTCQVCLGLFRDPQTLSCSHSYCKLCIKQLLQNSKENGKFACPQCRRLTSRREANHEDLMLAKLVSKLHEFWAIMPAEIGCDALTQNTQYYDNYTVPKHMRASQLFSKHITNTNTNTNNNNNNKNDSDSSHSSHSHHSNTSNISNISDIENELDSNIPSIRSRRVTFNEEDNDIHTINNDKAELEQEQENEHENTNSKEVNALNENNEPLYVAADLHVMSQNRPHCAANNDNMDVDEHEFDSNMDNDNDNDKYEPVFSLDPEAEHMDYTLDLDTHNNDINDINVDDIGDEDDINDLKNDDIDIDEIDMDLNTTLNPTMSMADINDMTHTNNTAMDVSHVTENNSDNKNKKHPLAKEIKSLSVNTVTVSTRSRRKRKLKKKKAATVTYTSHLLQSKTFMSSQIVFDNDEKSEQTSKQNHNDTAEKTLTCTPLKNRNCKNKTRKLKKLSKKKRNLSKLEQIGLTRADFIEGDFCAVCCMDDVDDIGVYCDGCNVFVHMQCYGIVCAPSEHEEWFCDPCKRDLSLHLNGGICCVICLTDIDCAYKAVVKCNKWAHTSCALWLTGVTFVNKQTLSPISIDNIDPDRYKLRCIFCKKRGGACLQCELCTHAFHVPCAHRGTAYLELREDGERVYFHSFCPLHADDESRNSVPDNNHDYPLYPRKNNKRVLRGRKRKREESDGEGMDEDDIDEQCSGSRVRPRSKSSLSPSKRKKINNKNFKGRERSKSEGNYNNYNSPQIFRSPDVRKHKLSDSAPVIMCSSLKEHQIDDYNNFKSKFSTVATFTTTWKNNVTHLVTAACIKRDKSKLSARTIKYFQAVIAGAWVVCFDWIKECLSKNTLVNESKYEVVADKHGAGACKKSRELRKKNVNDGGLFANIICVIASEFQYVKLDEDLRGIFRIGGATIRKMLPYQWLKDIEKYKKEMNGKKLIFVYDKEQTEMTAKQLDFAKRFGVLTMAYQQVFDAISNYTPI